MTTAALRTLPDEYRLTVEGRPVPAVRMTQRGKHVRPSAHRYLAYREVVGRTAQQYGITEPLDGRLWCRIWIYLRQRGTANIDNLAKAVIDGLAGLAFVNDRQIDDLRVRIYLADDERVDIAIGTLRHAT